MRCLRLAVLVCLGLAASSLSAQQAAKWNINDPVGPTSPIEFDTNEGTWMNLDVSPDGRQIVFDLLGDIYVMPTGGSGSQPAARLLGGAPFDMQPRFSPDGTRIAFTSDRDGLWNIWTMKTDGTDLKQVSRETRWFINSPTWAPEGQAIYARRHFVTTRSLGAGEVWMFHPAGSEGVKVTQREPEAIVARPRGEGGDDRLHGYPTSTGRLDVRRALAAWYRRRFDVALDPETQTLITWGTSEALAHLHFLEWEGRVRREREGDVWRFRRA